MLPEFGWTEMLVVAIVLIVVVGPKDLPRMLRTFGKTTASLRRMAGDFRKQFDEALKEAEMEDVRNIASDVRKLDPRNEIKDALSPLGKVGREMNDELKKATADFDKPDKKKSAAETALDNSGDKAREAKAWSGSARPNGKADEAAAQPAAKKSSSSKSKAASSKTGASKTGSSKAAPTKTAAAKPASSKSGPSATSGAKTGTKSAAAKSGSAASKAKSASGGGKARTKTAQTKAAPAEDKT